MMNDENHMGRLIYIYEHKRGGWCMVHSVLSPHRILSYYKHDFSSPPASVSIIGSLLTRFSFMGFSFSRGTHLPLISVTNRY